MSTSEEGLSDIMSGAGGLWKEAPAKAESTGETAAPPAVTAEPPKVEAKPDAKADGKAEAARDDAGRFAKTEAEKTAEKQETKPRVDVAGIIDERRKRQAVEAELAELRKEKPVAKPSVFDNEDEAIASRVSEANRPLREALYKQSVRIARLVYKDAFDQAEQAFGEAAEQDERLIKGLRASDDPGEYIYSMGMHIRELADVGGDLGKYREKLTTGFQSQIAEKDTRIKALETELAAMKTAQTDLDNVPRSLNTTSSGPSPKAGGEDPEELKSIVRFGNKSR